MLHRIGLLLSICVLFVTAPAPAGESVEVASHAGGLRPRQPQVAVSRGGTVYLAFGSRDTIHVSISRDRGRTYGEPVMVARLPGLMLGMRRGPRIAVAADAVVITAIARDGELQSWRSIDEGRTWAAAARVNNAPKSAREGLHAMAAGPNGELFCVWLDLRNEVTDVFGAGSSDGGQNWSPNRLVYRSPSGSVCECCHPSVAFDGQGGVVVMWRNSLDGNRDMYMARSDGIDRAFGPAEKLGGGTWRLDACPMDGGAVAVTSRGQATTVWRRDKQIFSTSPDAPEEQLLGSGMQPWAAAGGERVWLVWIEKRHGTLWMSEGDAQPARLSDQASDPVVAAAPGGMGPVIVAWEVGGSKAPAIRAITVGE